jgi:hypothetical protein
LSNKRRLFRGRSCSHQLPNNSDPFIDTCCLIQEGGCSFQLSKRDP